MKMAGELKKLFKQSPYILFFMFLYYSPLITYLFPDMVSLLEGKSSLLSAVIIALDFSIFIALNVLFLKYLLGMSPFDISLQDLIAILIFIGFYIAAFILSYGFLLIINIAFIDEGYVSDFALDSSLDLIFAVIVGMGYWLCFDKIRHSTYGIKQRFADYKPYIPLSIFIMLFSLSVPFLGIFGGFITFIQLLLLVSLYRTQIRNE